MWIPFFSLIFSVRSLCHLFLRSGHCLGIALVLPTPWSVHLKNASITFGPCLFVWFWMINVKRSPWISTRQRQNNVLVACERNAHGSHFTVWRHQATFSNVSVADTRIFMGTKKVIHIQLFSSAFTPFNLRLCLCLSLCVHLIARTYYVLSF